MNHTFRYIDIDATVTKSIEIVLRQLTAMLGKVLNRQTCLIVQAMLLVIRNSNPCHLERIAPRR